MPSPSSPSAANGRLPTLLLTGAAGDMAGQLRPLLRESFHLRLTDVRPLSEPPVVSETMTAADLSDPVQAMGAITGADAVVHLAGNPNFTASWDAVEQANVTVTERVLRAARDTGVGTVVLASSLHTAGGYVRDGRTPVDPAWPARPCCLYGASKVATEALGYVYAHRYGLGVTCLRIGWATPRPRLHSLALDLWVSPQDLAQLVTRAVLSSRRFGVYFGISANTQRRWLMDNARDELGYQPIDDAEEHWVGRPGDHAACSVPDSVGELEMCFE